MAHRAHLILACQSRLRLARMPQRRSQWQSSVCGDVRESCDSRRGHDHEQRWTRDGRTNGERRRGDDQPLRRRECASRENCADKRERLHKCRRCRDSVPRARRRLECQWVSESVRNRSGERPIRPGRHRRKLPHRCHSEWRQHHRFRRQPREIRFGHTAAVGWGAGCAGSAAQTAAGSPRECAVGAQKLKWSGAAHAYLFNAASHLAISPASILAHSASDASMMPRLRKSSRTLRLS